MRASLLITESRPPLEKRSAKREGAVRANDLERGCVALSENYMSPGVITNLLQAWGNERAALDQLAPWSTERFIAMAEHYMQGENVGNFLQLRSRVVR
jgi:hypothetical protein